MRQIDRIEARAQRRRISRRVRRTPQRGFGAPPFEDEEREIVLGGDDKVATP